MRHIIESASVIAVILAAIIIKESLHVETLYLISGAVLVIGVYATHQFVEYVQGKVVQRRFPWLRRKTGQKNSTMAIEGRVRDDSTIFLITPDLYNDAQDPDVQKVVESNLRRGVTYTYLTRDDNEEAEAHITEVMYRFRKYHPRVRILPINDIFGAVPTYNILILEHNEHGRLCVFVELPVQEGNERVWWVEADKTLALRWHRRVLEIIKGRDPLHNPYSAD